MKTTFQQHSTQEQEQKQETMLCSVLGFVLYGGFLSVSDICSLHNIPVTGAVIADPENWEKLVCTVDSEEELERLEFLYSNLLKSHRNPIHIELAITGRDETVSHAEMLRRVVALGPMVRGLNLNGSHIRGNEFKCLAELTSLQSLNIGFCKGVTGNSLEYLAGLQSLTDLKLDGCSGIWGHGLAHLSGLQLRSLDLSSCKGAMIDIEHLPKTLKTLRLGGSGVTSAIIGHLTGLHELRSLDLSRCYEITNDDIAELLTELSNLEELNLSLCYRIADESMEHIAGLKSLRCLDLSFCDAITSDGLRQLARTTRLQHLIFQSCDFRDLTWVNELESLPLVSLDISYCRDDTGCTPNFAKLKSLQDLNLRGWRKIEPVVVDYLVEMKSLRNLNLRECIWVTNDDVARFAEMKTLQSLDLSKCHITDKIFAPVAGSNLERLILQDCIHITARGIAKLNGMMSLQVLDIRGCINIIQ
jgi:Leucine-rich repeat (LRR) protein